MSRFTADTRAEAVLTATRAQAWDALSDPDLVAELTPYARSIRVDGDHWVWRLSGLSVLGIDVAPSFTERMTLDEPRRIEFRHDPPAGVTERSGVEGWYSLEEAEAGTRLVTSMEITLDLPLPKVSRPAVEAVMDRVIAQMGARFSKNLLAHLGAEQTA